MASVLASELWENRFYTVVDRSELASEIQQAGFSEGDEESLDDLLLAARQAGLDGIIFGEVLEYRCEDATARNTNWRLPGTAEGTDSEESRRSWLGFETKEASVRQGTVTVAFRLVDVKSGEIRASRKVTHRFSKEHADGQSEFPNEDEILADLSQQCLDDIVHMLAPHCDSCHVELSLCDIWTKGRRDVKHGIELALQGDWKAAEDAWHRALRKDPENHAALFNLAVAAAERQDFAAAEDLAMQALRVQHKDCYAKGLETIRANRDAFEKSEDQRDARVVSATESVWR